ncbi:energy-coupling factor transporter ATPase [Limosilactobacillus ingluviei]|uniref:energy-coupling factor transporter ATPase n=1 Tax=Limosilactobacillus ingluviei TaxID=148604 RepID=UPI0023F2CDB4|nr:energy-coupling factor transporter ATPase [Limosilactobacillus ingluviei]
MVEAAVSYQGVTFRYHEAGAAALQDFTATVPKGRLTAVIGHTGSGKSTLMQLTDGLLTPTAGQLEVLGQVITPRTKNKALHQLHRQVGFVFQFPEHQLFAETVLADVMFGPLNLGQTPAQAEQAAHQALAQLGVGEALWQRSPFELSGGQQRRVAIAGVLAMRPQLLILDEPTAGLDPDGQRELLALVEKLKDQGLTILLITHQMEQVAQLADTVLVLAHGQLQFSGQPRALFAQPEFLTTQQLALPAAVAFAKQLQTAGISQFNQLPLTLDELAHALARQLKGDHHEQ